MNPVGKECKPGDDNCADKFEPKGAETCPPGQVCGSVDQLDNKDTCKDGDPNCADSINPDPVTIEGGCRGLNSNLMQMSAEERLKHKKYCQTLAAKNDPTCKHADHYDGADGADKADHFDNFPDSCNNHKFIASRSKSKSKATTKASMKSSSCIPNE